MIDSCSYPEMIRNELVYKNDFENLNLNAIDGEKFLHLTTQTFLGTLIMMGLLFLLKMLEIMIMFYIIRLYIHGSWDGNFNGFTENDKPDKWVMEFKPDMQPIKIKFR